MIIGVTDTGKPSYDKYAEWIAQGKNVTIKKLSFTERNIRDLEQCDGVVLTGGEDVHPKFYNQPELLNVLNSDDINETRDIFEIEIIEQTMKKNIPLLAICRGMQILNVAYGGTLIYDVPTAGFFSHRFDKTKSERHKIYIATGSILASIVNNTEGKVNSFHHQAVHSISSDLLVVAKSADGVVEAIERREKNGFAFLLGVQWHPERMSATEEQCSNNIAQRFLHEIQLRQI
ncbi:MAG: gamma-glutamyl-gamma-aminobutyrate hydrolase family protein [Bacteroidota bacterium]